MAPKLSGELAGLKVVDADSHLVETHDLWTSRVPEKYRELVPHVVKDSDGRDVWLYNGEEVLARGGAGSNVALDGKKVPLKEYVMSDGLQFDEVHVAGHDPVARVEMLDKLGIWAQIAYPNVTGFSAEKFTRMEDQSIARLIASTYNDAAADFQRASHDRVFPMAIIPFWDIDAAVAEAVRSKSELGLHGITMCSEPYAAVGLPDLLDTHWDPLWEVCSDLSIPVNFHVGATEFGKEAFLKGVWPSHDKVRKLLIGASLLELHQGRILANLVMSDLFSRFPKIKWVLVESGIGWVPFVLERLEYQVADTEIEGKHNLPRPRQQFRDHMYSCFWFEEFAPVHALEWIGFDNVLFESDFPHATCLYPSPVEHGLRVLEKWGPDVTRKVMSENAAKLYDIPL